MTTTSRVQRYVEALQNEAEAVRKLTKAMEKQSTLEADIQGLEKHYKRAVGERRDALRALWGKRI